MKSRIGNTLAASLLALAIVLVFAAIPASADVLYDNTGPNSLTTNAWSFFDQGGGGTSVTNSFTLIKDSYVTGFNFVVWVDQLDSLASATWTVSATPFGAAIATGSVTGNTEAQVSSTFGLAQLQESFSIPALYLLGSTTYYFQLSDGVDAFGTGIYWDESAGASTAFLSGFGAINSETFQVNGSPVPEPSSFLLLGNGMLALAGVATRRKLRLGSHS